MGAPKTAIIRSPEIATGLGSEAGSGAVELDCQQTFVQLPLGGGDDCLHATYPPAARVAYTTGKAEASFLNGAPKVGNGMISPRGENFDCAGWTVQDGPGKLAGAYLVEENEQAGDVANVNLLDD